MHSTVCHVNSLSFCLSQNVLYTHSVCQVRAEEWLWDVITCWQEPSEYRHVKKVWNIVKAVKISVLAGWHVLLDKNGPGMSAAVRQKCHLYLSYLKWFKSRANYNNNSSKDNCMWFWHTAILTGDFCPLHFNIWHFRFMLLLFIAIIMYGTKWQRMLL